MRESCVRKEVQAIGISMLYNDEVKSVSLGISKIALRRERKQRSRVEYLIDPGGDEASGFGVPEKVVLQRWRQKTSKKYAFGGMRLSPNIWRSIQLSIGINYFDEYEVDTDFIDEKNQQKKMEIKSYKYPIISGANVQKLVQGLGLMPLRAIMQRHNNPTRIDTYGTPDLYLWAIRRSTQKIAFTRLVEVKKPLEPLSPDQKAELFYLRHDLGLEAGFLRLIEKSKMQTAPVK